MVALASKEKIPFVNLYHVRAAKMSYKVVLLFVLLKMSPIELKGCPAHRKKKKFKKIKDIFDIFDIFNKIG